MKLFKKKDKKIEAEETLAKNAESAKTAAEGKTVADGKATADGKNAGAAQETKEDVPETIVCPKCGKTVLKSVVKQHKYVCYECNYYFRVRAKNRIRMVSDKEAFEPWFTELTTGNPLNFPEYEEKIAKTQEKTGLSEGIVIGKTKIYGEETVLGVIDSRFMMGSMGHVVGEKITSAFERATFIVCIEGYFFKPGVSLLVDADIILRAELHRRLCFAPDNRAAVRLGNAYDPILHTMGVLVKHLFLLKVKLTDRFQIRQIFPRQNSAPGKIRIHKLKISLDGT